MPISRLLRLVDAPGGLFIAIRWRNLPPGEDTIEPLAKVYHHVPQLVEKLLERRSTSADLRHRARTELRL